MARASTGRKRGVGSRIGWPLKIFIGALLVLLVLMILNALALDNETESAELTIPGAELVNTSSGQLQVLDTGAPGTPLPPAAALPIVLIHGSAGAINWWDDLIPLLERDHRVIAIDMLGYGGSDKPDSNYSIETQGSLVAQVLTGLDVSRAVLVGHSLGGKFVTSVAEQSPDLVTGLVIIDTAPDDSYGGLSGGARASRTPMLGQALWRIAPDFMIRRNVAQGFAPGYDVPDKFVDDVRAMTYPAYRESALRGEEYTRDQTLPDRLSEVGKPLLVIFGEEDQIFDARESISAFAAIPDTETLLIPDVGHSPQVEAPELTAEAIDAFAGGLARAERARVLREQAAARAKARARARARAARQQARQRARNQANSARNNARQRAQAGNRQGGQR